jgi:hypothetical protein
METPHSSSRRKGRDIARARLRQEKVRALVIGLLVGLIFAAVVGLMIWKFSQL